MNNPSAPASSVSATPSRVMQRTWGGILWLLVFTSVIVLLTTSSQPGQSQVAQNGTGRPEVEIVFERDGKQIPGKLVQRQVAPFRLTERSGKEVTEADLRGKPWAVNFVFTSCVQTCPANTTAMMKLVAACAELDVQFVTITVDPERDTTTRLTEYAEIYGADPERWWFLTGDKQVIHDLIKNNFLQVVDEKQGENRLLGYEFAHSDRVMHIAADGKILGQYLSTDPVEMARLKRVLAGEMETPDEHKFLVVAPVDEEVDNIEIEAPLLEEPQAETVEHLRAETAEHSQIAITESVPDWITNLPAVNAGLNSLATLLLGLGFLFIKAGHKKSHQLSMISAFLVSVLFLACYLTYHFSLHYYTGESSKKFPDLGFIRQVYLIILISHVLLAVSVPVLALKTFWHAWKQQWNSHRFWARITFPIWLYVSVTGVVIYLMLYQLAGQAS